MSTPRIAFTWSRLRVEEKLLIQEFERRQIPVERIDDGRLILDSGDPEPGFDVLLNRSISFGRTLATLRYYENRGVRTINRSSVVETCGDKWNTWCALERASVPQPRAMMAFSEESALAAIERLGYPVVLKPVVGSWGRLVARINDRDSAEALLEHRATLGSWQHRIFFIQQFIDKPGRDLRVFCVGEQAICGIYRNSEHWITNTARGAVTAHCPVDGAVGDVALRAAQAVGGGIIAVDLAEDRDGRLYVLEVNHTTEFRNSIEVTGVDIPARIVDFVLDHEEETA